MQYELIGKVALVAVGGIAAALLGRVVRDLWGRLPRSYQNDFADGRYKQGLLKFFSLLFILTAPYVLLLSLSVYTLLLVQRSGALDAAVAIWRAVKTATPPADSPKPPKRERDRGRGSRRRRAPRPKPSHTPAPAPAPELAQPATVEKPQHSPPPPQVLPAAAGASEGGRQRAPQPPPDQPSPPPAPPPQESPVELFLVRLQKPAG